MLEGEIDVTFRGATATARAGHSVNVPANAPHAFHNSSAAPARLLCMVSPACLEGFFRYVGDPVASRTSPAPKLDDTARGERMTKAVALAPRYGIESL